MRVNAEYNLAAQQRALSNDRSLHSHMVHLLRHLFGDSHQPLTTAYEGGLGHRTCSGAVAITLKAEFGPFSATKRLLSRLQQRTRYKP